MKWLVKFLLHFSKPMASFFEKIKDVDQRTNDVVNGYLRNQQSLLPYTDNPYYLIPSLVIHLILSFYFDPEYFESDSNGYYKVSDDGKTVQKAGGSYNCSVYGHAVIPSHLGGIYEWTFKIIVEGISISIGITADIHKTFKKGFWRNTNHSNYAAVYSGHKASKNEFKYGYPIERIRDGDIVKMHLDLNKKQLIFWINDKDLGPAWKNIDVGEDIQYKMAIVATSGKIKLELMDFKRINH